MTTIKGSESGATVRNRLSKSIVLAIRLLMRQQSPDALSRDLAAYVVLALEKIAESVEVSASAWEKRDYWLKAIVFVRNGRGVNAAREGFGKRSAFE